MSRKTLSKIKKSAWAIIGVYATLTIFFSDDATALNNWSIKQINQIFEIAFEPIELPLVVVLICISYIVYSLSTLAPQAKISKFSAKIFNLFSHEITVGQWYVDNNAENQLRARVGSPIEDGAWKLDVLNSRGQGIYGPYVDLPPGKYEAIFQVKVTDSDLKSSEIFARLDVITDKDTSSILNEKPLRQTDFAAENVYQNITLDFKTSVEKHDVEFRLITERAYRGPVSVILKNVIVLKA